MHKITLDDIQHIGDEDTLLHFLQEKLNLPIPENATLPQIALPLPLPFLELDESVVEHIIDCQDFRGLPQDGLNEQRPFLIRFKREQDYAEILRRVAESLSKKNINPAGLFFLCADENFQPFAFAYFNDSKSENWQTAVLNVLAWTQKNTHIHTSWEHKLPSSFFDEEPSDKFEKDLEDKTEINEFDLTKSPSAYDLSDKLKSNLLDKFEVNGLLGERLGMLESIHSGITTGCDRVFIIDAGTREYLLSEDPNSIEFIKRSPRVNRKWKCEPKYLIGILSSHITQWPWSHAKGESAAERIFEKEYPAIHAHLSRHKNRLKKRTRSIQGKFYWEMSNKKLDSVPRRSEIIYPLYPTVMQAVYDPLEGIPTSSFCIIPTTDLSLLAILNSNCFQWYAKTNYLKPIGNRLSNQLALTKTNMQNFPISPRIRERKVELSDLVQQILNNPDSSEIPNLEKEIDQLVYELYGLTDAEIALIKKGNNL